MAVAVVGVDMVGESTTTWRDVETKGPQGQERAASIVSSEPQSTVPAGKPGGSSLVNGALAFPLERTVPYSVLLLLFRRGLGGQ